MASSTPYQLVIDLNAQWRRLCDGAESAATVSAALDGWRRDPRSGLRTVGALSGILAAVERAPDQVLGFLIAAAQTGDGVAGRVVLQALLPKLVLIARSQQRAQLPMEEVVSEACAILWERVACYPLASRPAAVAANLALDTLKTLRRQHHSPEPPTPVAFLSNAVSTASHAAVSDELAAVLTNACRLGVIEPEEAVLLTRVYQYDQTEACAFELGVSPGAVRKRCSLLKARLRPRAHELVA